MNKKDKIPDRELVEQLELFRQTLPLPPEIVAQEKQNFLSLGEFYRSGVSTRRQSRHKVWNSFYPSEYPGKEFKPMFNTLLTVIVCLAVMLVSATTSVIASQDSLPVDILYPVKNWSEIVRLALSQSEQGRLDLELEFSQRRMTEISRGWAALWMGLGKFLRYLAVAQLSG